MRESSRVYKNVKRLSCGEFQGAMLWHYYARNIIKYFFQSPCYYIQNCSQDYLLWSKLQSLYNTCPCTIPVPVQYTSLYNTCHCTIHVTVQYKFLYNICHCTIPVPVQYLSLYNMCHCEIPVTVQYLSLYNTFPCTIPVPVQYKSLYNTCHCTILVPVQYLSLYNKCPLYNTCHCTIPVLVQYLSLYNTCQCTQIQIPRWNEALIVSNWQFRAVDEEFLGRVLVLNWAFYLTSSEPHSR
jgi:hypothetical protein